MKKFSHKSVWSFLLRSLLLLELNDIFFTYPNESFSTISNKKVNNIPVRGNGKGNHEGNEYTVKSNDTGIEFV